MTRYNHRLFQVIVCMFGGMLLLSQAVFPAQATELADAKSELAQSIDELLSVTSDIEAAQNTIDELTSAIEDKAADIENNQVKFDEVKAKRDEALVKLYKMGGTPGLVDFLFSSRDFNELLNNLFYVERIENKANSLYREQRDIKVALDNEIAELHKAKDEQDNLVNSMRSRQEELSDTINELKDKIDSLDANQRATYAAASELAAAQVFASGDTSDWQTGVASAYGGHSDDSLPSNASTATGDAVTETSMGVAIPMAWDDFRSYYGRKVEISYNGQSVIATVNDCGGMGCGSRSLDLQPGVFRAFGFETCDEWGLRTVAFRFL